MKILSSHNVDLTKYGLKGSAYYIRVSPGELEITIKEILIELSNFSWLAKFNKAYLKKSMEHKAQATCDYLKKSFYDDQDNPLISNAGEYIVSTLSKRSIVEELGHLDVPLAELLGRKKVGNPGFDFFTEDYFLLIIFAWYNVKLTSLFEPLFEIIDSFPILSGLPSVSVILCVLPRKGGSTYGTIIQRAVL